MIRRLYLAMFNVYIIPAVLLSLTRAAIKNITQLHIFIKNGDINILTPQFNL